jgi:hypothetical protein
MSEGVSEARARMRSIGFAGKLARLTVGVKPDTVAKLIGAVCTVKTTGLSNTGDRVLDARGLTTYRRVRRGGDEPPGRTSERAARFEHAA